MTGCEGVRDLAQASLDGELAAAERERLERHLGACPACRRVVTEYRALFAILPRPAAPDLPAGFASRTLARVGAVRRWRRVWQAAALAGACLVACGVAMIAAWDVLLSAVESLGEGNLSLGSWWSSAYAAASHAAEDAAAAGGACLSLAPGGAAAVAMLLAALAAQVLFILRWRSLARPDVPKIERAVQ